MSRPLPGTTVGAFKWNPTKRRAAFLLAEGELKTQAVADHLGVHRKTLWDWQQNDEFQREVDKIDRQLDRDLYRAGLAKQRVRVAKLESQAEWLERVSRITQDPTLAREYRAYLRQIAEERGQIGPNRKEEHEREEPGRLLITELRVNLGDLPGGGAGPDPEAQARAEAGARAEAKAERDAALLAEMGVTSVESDRRVARHANDERRRQAARQAELRGIGYEVEVEIEDVDG